MVTSPVFYLTVCLGLALQGGLAPRLCSLIHIFLIEGHKKVWSRSGMLVGGPERSQPISGGRSERREKRRDMNVREMSDVVALLECFRGPESTSTDEERALRLLSRHPHPEQVRKIRDHEVDYFNDHSQSSLLHYACLNGWYDVSRELVDKYQCDPHLVNRVEYTPLHCNEDGSIDLVAHCQISCGGVPL